MPKLSHISCYYVVDIYSMWLAEIVFAYFVHYNEFNLMRLRFLLVIRNLSTSPFDFQFIGEIIGKQGGV